MTIAPKSKGRSFVVLPPDSFACAHGTVISLKHKADSEGPSDICMIHVRKALIKYDRPAVGAVWMAVERESGMSRRQTGMGTDIYESLRK